MVFSQYLEKVPSTRQLAIKNTNVASSDDRKHVVYEHGVPARVILRSSATPEQSISAEVSPMMVIGRKASMRDNEVTIDLTEFNAADAGVSRYHAMFLALDNHIYVKDIDSLNGSLLNGKRMKTSQEYVIMDRDIIAFGDLEFRIEFDYD